MTTRIAGNALLFLTLMSGCSSPGGGGAGGRGGGAGLGGGAAGSAGTAGGSGSSAGGAGGHAGLGGDGGRCNFVPSGPPFGCRATYAEELASICADPNNRGGHTATCGAFQATERPYGFGVMWCAYDQSGQLAWARACDDVPGACVEDGGRPNCFTSTGAPAPAPECVRQEKVVCGGGGAGGRGGVGGGGSGGGGGGRGGGGGGGQCGTQPPSGEPFNCRATHAEQALANCALDRVGTAIATAGTCDGYQQLSAGSGFYTVKCSYDQQGTLAWAERCEDSQVWCGNFCTVSAGAPPTPHPSCQLTQMCVHTAAAD